MDGGKIQRATQQQVQQAQQQGKPKTLMSLVQDMKGEIARALPSVITPERFMRITLTALSSNPDLKKCTQESFLGAMMQAAQLGVEPNTPLGQAYLIPYKNYKKGGILECQFQLGYKGMIDLAYRSGEVVNIQAKVVREADLFEYEFGINPMLRHVPARGNRGDATDVWAMYKTRDGGYGFEVWSMDDIRAFAQAKSKAYGSGPWKTDFDAMAKKTVLKQLLKYAPMKSDFIRAVNADETVKNYADGKADMLDDPDINGGDYEVIDDETPQKAAPVTVDNNTGEIIDGQQTL